MPDKKQGNGSKQAGSKDTGKAEAAGNNFKDDPKRASEAGKKGGAATKGGKSS